MNKYLQSKTPYILAVALSLFLYQLYMVAKSFPAEYNITIVFLSRIETRGLWWASLWYSSEISGEIGLLVRFAGACFVLSTALTLFARKKIIIPHVRKAILLEAIYYLFYIPFTIYWVVSPYSSTAMYEADISYSAQILLVFPSLIMLYSKLRRQDTDREGPQVLKWVAIVSVCYVFALWIKHAMLGIYAIGINLENPILIIGFINSTFTLLIAAFATMAVSLPIIKEKRAYPSPKATGGILVCIGVYFAIYVLISLSNPIYLSFLTLTELWGIAMPILGFSLIKPET